MASTFVLGGMLAGCGSTTTTATPATGSRTAVVAMPVNTEPNWFFPVLASTAYSDINSQMNFLMYKPLVAITSQDTVDYHRSVAKAIHYNKQGTRYVITLNPRFRWSNGRPVTAQDVIFTWNIMKAASQMSSNPPWTYGGAGGGGIPSLFQSVQAHGANKVVVTLNKAVNQSWFIHNGLGQIIPVPKATWDKYPHNMNKELTFIKSVANSPNNSIYSVVDGPFKFSNFQPNNYWAFVPNKAYGGHRANLTKLQFQYFTSSSAEFTALKTGAINVGYLPPSLWNARKQLTKDTRWKAYLFGFNMIRVNQNPKALNGLGSAFSHAYVRRALEMGVNQAGIIQSIYHNNAIPETSPIPSRPQTPFYDPHLSQNPNAFNLKAGRKLLEAHGWHLVNGVMTKNGITLSMPLIYNSGSSTVASTVQLLKTDWAKEGIKIALVPEPYDTVITTMHSNPAKWAMAYWGGGWTYQPDYYPSGGQLFAKGSAANAGDYRSHIMDTLIRASYQPGTAQQTMQALSAYEKWAWKDVPDVWMPVVAQLNEHSQSIHGVAKTFNAITALYAPNRWTFK